MFRKTFKACMRALAACFAPALPREQPPTADDMAPIDKPAHQWAPAIVASEETILACLKKNNAPPQAYAAVKQCVGDAERAALYTDHGHIDTETLTDMANAMSRNAGAMSQRQAEKARATDGTPTKDAEFREWQEKNRAKYELSDDGTPFVP